MGVPSYPKIETLFDGAVMNQYEYALDFGHGYETVVPDFMALNDGVESMAVWIAAVRKVGHAHRARVTRRIRPLVYETVVEVEFGRRKYYSWGDNPWNNRMKAVN